jgi:hypothetical protein
MFARLLSSAAKRLENQCTGRKILKTPKSDYSSHGHISCETRPISPPHRPDGVLVFGTRTSIHCIRFRRRKEPTTHFICIGGETRNEAVFRLEKCVFIRVFVDFGWCGWKRSCGPADPFKGNDDTALSRNMPLVVPNPSRFTTRGRRAGAEIQPCPCFQLKPRGAMVLLRLCLWHSLRHR